MSQRYYFFRKSGQPDGGVYKIHDRVLDVRIASCDFKENAVLICTTLNGFMKLEVEVINLRGLVAQEPSQTLALEEQVKKLEIALQQARDEARRNAVEASRLQYPDTTGS